MKKLFTKMVSSVIVIVMMLGIVTTTASAAWYDANLEKLGLTATIDIGSYYATRYETCNLLLNIEQELLVSVGRGRLIAENGRLVGFSDLNDISNTQMPNVQLMVALGLMSGTNENGKIYIRPNNYVTRAEAAALIGRANDIFGYFGKAIRNSKSFSDVPNNYWAVGYINTVYSLGVMNGSGVNTFNPKGNITLAELLTIVYNLVDNGKIPQSVANKALIATFPSALKYTTSNNNSNTNNNNNNTNSDLHVNWQDSNNNNNNSDRWTSNGKPVDTGNNNHSNNGNGSNSNTNDNTNNVELSLAYGKVDGLKTGMTDGYLNVDVVNGIDKEVQIYFNASNAPSVSYSGAGTDDIAFLNGATAEKVGDNLYCLSMYARFASAASNNAPSVTNFIVSDGNETIEFALNLYSTNNTNSNVEYETPSNDSNNNSNDKNVEFSAYAEFDGMTTDMCDGYLNVTVKNGTDTDVRIYIRSATAPSVSYSGAGTDDLAFFNNAEAEYVSDNLYCVHFYARFASQYNAATGAPSVTSFRISNGDETMSIDVNLYE